MLGNPINKISFLSSIDGISQMNGSVYTLLLFIGVSDPITKSKGHVVAHKFSSFKRNQRSILM